MIIAIDGPAGSGKSTVAKKVAKLLDFHYLDTGAMYRCIAWLALERGVSLDDADAVAELAASEPIVFAHEAGNPLPSGVAIAGTDVTLEIRTPRIDKSVSAVSAIPAVREALTNQQRTIAASDNIVMEGRDIGTVVLPNADLKIFLTASDTARAMRRYKELCERQGSDAPSYDEVLTLVRQRDRQDSGRETAPLKMADDAVLADTSDLDFEGSVKLIEHLIASNTALGGVRK